MRVAFPFICSDTSSQAHPGCRCRARPEDTAGSKLTQAQLLPGLLAGMQLVYGCGPHPRGILLPWDTGPCLGTYVVVTTEGAPGIEWMGATDAALHPTVPAPHPPRKRLASASAVAGGDPTLALKLVTAQWGQC